MKPLKRKEIFVCEDIFLEDSLEKQDISVEQEYLKISSGYRIGESDFYLWQLLREKWSGLSLVLLYCFYILHLQEHDESLFLQFLPKEEFLGDIFKKEDILNADSE